MVITYNTINYSPAVETQLGLSSVMNITPQMKSKRQRGNNNRRYTTFEEILEKKEKEIRNEDKNTYIPIGNRLGKA